MRTSSLHRAALLTLAVASSAAAQTSSSPGRSESDTSELRRRSSVSLSFVQNRPQGAFGQHVGLGYGLDAAYSLRLDAAGIWSLRTNIGVVSYGDESRRAALSESVGGRVNVDVKTTNYIVPVSIGPQISWPTGPVRPYANAGVGGLAFFTESRVQGTSDLAAFASTTNHSAAVGLWTFGAGVYMPLSVGTRQVELDLGMQYYAGGTARYLAPGSIVDLPGAQISVTPLESTTHMTIIRFGARLHL
jgi:hypothetical protein